MAPRLKEYRRKRDFEVTPEPPPRRRATRTRAGRPSFMVHKHDASRLHYDLRLEMDGALASWAVPKGPSFDPSLKRLAVQTEDHPLEYGRFEGRIPDGEYGAGDSLIWDRGDYDTIPPGQASEQRKRGHLHLELRGEKLRGRWHLVRTRAQGGKSQWLLFKAKDDAADARFDVVAARPESVVSGRRVTRGPVRGKVLRAVHPDPEKLLDGVWPPMLATLVDAPPDGDWLAEVKYDGFRALSGLSGRRVAMWSRNRLDLSSRFPGIARALERLVVGEAVIDGEAVALDAGGVARFERLQRGEHTVLFAFDLLWLDGEDLRARPLEERRDLLASLLANAPPELRLAERVDGDPGAALERAAKHGYEGLVLKQRGGRYLGGRSREWLKLKALAAQELAVVGYTPNRGHSHAVGALLLGVAEGAKLHYAGKVGTGFSAKMRAQLERELARDAVDEPRVDGAPRMRDAVWVEPRLVAQVRFTEWTDDGKLRHPSFQGLRDDKTPRECVRERPAAAAAASPTVTLSHPEKLLYPKDGLTKQDLADYYAAVAEPMLRALAARPLALEHWPRGVGAPSWFHQNIGKEGEPWMTYAETPSERRLVRHLVADSPEALRWLAQRSVLTVHMWSARAPDFGMPDWVVFDLDPAEGHGIEQVIDTALALKALCDELSLPSVPKTSGKRGLHVLVPLAAGHTHEDAVEFALHLGRAITSVRKEATLERAKAKRRGRLYFDCHQNGYGKTIVAPYSPRGIDGAPVSAPLDWSEVTHELDPTRFNVKTMPRRLADRGDLFAPALTAGVRLPRFG